MLASCAFLHCRRGRQRGAALLANLLALTLTACTPAPPQPSVGDEYVRRRSKVVDRTQPCRIEAYDPALFKVFDHQIYLPVTVNGVATIGAMDTGGIETVVTPELAAAAKLDISSYAMEFVGATGGFEMHPARASQMEVGPITLAGGIPLQVYSFAGSNGVKFGVNIGLSVLEHFDFDMDLPHGVLRPYRVINCFTIDPPWPNTSSALALTRGATEGLTRDEIDAATTFGKLNGVSLPVAFPRGTIEALFDTGAVRSAMSFEGARSVGVTSAELDADPVATVTGVNGRDVIFSVHSFPEMVVGEDALHNVPIQVARHFDRRDTWPMILGMDYIEHHHLWLSYSTNALYIDSGEKKPVAPAGR